MYSRESFRLIAHNLARVLAQPRDLLAREQMLLAATMAGIAIENSMLGAAHATANPVTARYQVPHGVAVGMMMLFVMDFNAEDPGVACRLRRPRAPAQSGRGRRVRSASV